MALRDAPTRELRLDKLMGGRGRTKAHVMKRLDAGDTLASIAKDLGVCQTTLYKWIIRWRKEGAGKDLAA